MPEPARASVVLRRWSDAVGIVTGRGATWYLVIVGPILLASALAGVTADAPRIVGWLLLAVWAGLFLWAASFLWTEFRRARLKRVLGRFPRAAPFAFATSLAMQGVFLFATAVTVLLRHELTRRGTVMPITEPNDALDFFMWQLFDAVPGVDLNETIGWIRPLDYDDVRVGWLVVAFQAAILAPIFLSLRWFWTVRHDGARRWPKLPRYPEPTH